MNSCAAITICSINYLSKALVLSQSYKKHHPDHDTYLLLVDRKREDLDIYNLGINIIWVEDLGIPDFSKNAFTYDVIEFNTNVKPFVLKKLLQEYSAAVYLDPDIKVYAPLEPVFDAIRDGASFVVTPHYNNPILDGCKPDDIELLKFGAFNLGFIAVSNSSEALSFLDWWSDRCLKFGFYEPQSGLGVDQKWVTLAPNFFPNLKVLHDAGLNVAFWNLHERNLSEKDGIGYVNGNTRLRFIHFSSYDDKSPETVGKKQSRFPIGSRPDFTVFSKRYSDDLNSNLQEKYSNIKYGFDFFESGEYITPALRRFYAGLKDEFFVNEDNPFLENGMVMKFAKKAGLIGAKGGSSLRANFKDLNSHKKSIKLIGFGLRFMLRVLGPDRYYNLMRYFAHISSIRNQAHIFSSNELRKFEK